MKYQKIINLLDDSTNQPSKFRTRNWAEINDESRGAYNNDDNKLIMMIIIMTMNLKRKW